MIFPAYPAHSMWSLRRAEQDPLAFLRTLVEKGADIIPFQLGRHPAFLLNHPTHVEDVFLTHPDKFVKGRGFDRAKRLLGNGLLTASGVLHSERRRAAQGAFHRGRMTAYAPIMVAHARRLRGRWEHGSAIDVTEDMHELTLAIASEALFGADLGGCAADVSRAIAAAVPKMDALVSLVAAPRQVRRARRVLDAIVDGVVDRRIRSSERHDDLLSLLLAARGAEDEASAEQLRDDAVTFLLAGHDTLANALAWSWMLLAEHPEAEERLGAELREVVGDQLPCEKDLEHLTLTKSVLAESLRLFPPAWVIVRRAIEAHQLGNALIPAGAIVVASPFVMHRDARFFPEPLEFKPARWLAGPAGPGRCEPLAAPRPSLAYFPFGAGARSCIGEAFAWTEGTLVLATLAQNWRLTRPKGAPMVASPRITLRPQGTVFMTPAAR